MTTSISGLQALSFWTLRADFEISWWAANVFLFLWPLPFVAHAIWNADDTPSNLAAA